jgi:hypothetical protein
MKFKLWLFVTLSLVLSTLALFGVHAFGGSGDIASAQGPTLELDMVQDAGGTWCNPVNSSTTNDVDDNHQVAICLINGTDAASDFNIVVTFDNSLNSCSSTGQTGTGLNANPDFISTVGTGWDCSGGGLNYPRCGVDAVGNPAGEAFITCGTVNDPGTLSGPWPIAVINFTAIAGGMDDLDFGTVALYDYLGENILRCPSASCIGATDDKIGPTPQATSTPTNTPQPTATSTPCPNGICPTSTPTPRAFTQTPTPGPTSTPSAEEPTSAPPPPPPPPPSGGGQPSVTPPSTGTGSEGVAWTDTLMFVLAGGAALSLAFGGGLYLRRVRNR